MVKPMSTIHCLWHMQKPAIYLYGQCRNVSPGPSLFLFYCESGLCLHCIAVAAVRPFSKLRAKAAQALSCAFVHAPGILTFSFTAMPCFAGGPTLRTQDPSFTVAEAMHCCTSSRCSTAQPVHYYTAQLLCCLGSSPMPQLSPLLTPSRWGLCTAALALSFATPSTDSCAPPCRIVAVRSHKGIVFHRQAYEGCPRALFHLICCSCSQMHMAARWLHSCKSSPLCGQNHAETGTVLHCTSHAWTPKVASSLLRSHCCTDAVLHVHAERVSMWPQLRNRQGNKQLLHLCVGRTVRIMVRRSTSCSPAQPWHNACVERALPAQGSGEVWRTPCLEPDPCEAYKCFSRRTIPGGAGLAIGFVVFTDVLSATTCGGETVFAAWHPCPVVWLVNRNLSKLRGREGGQSIPRQCILTLH